MKISKVLFIGFFSVLALGCLSFLIPAKEEMKDNENSHVVECKTHEYDVPDFKYLVVNKDVNVTVHTTDRANNYFSFSIPKDSIIEDCGFSINGDTLFVTATNNFSNNYADLYCKVMQKIYNQGYTKLENNQLALEIYSEGGQMVIDSKQTASKVTFTGVNASLYCHSDSLKECRVDLTNSKVECWSRSLELLDVDAKENSEVKTRPALQMSMKGDPDTRYDFLR